MDQFDPFLLLDEMGPSQLAPGEAKGAPDHPHRGFETVTYVFSGELEHEDSAGHRGKLGPGDVQWMTAGAGVVHSEMPSRAFLEKGGKMHALQVWVNLPRRDKRMAPRYQEFRASQIPTVLLDEGRVKVKLVAGTLANREAVIQSRTPMLYFDVSLEPGANTGLPVPQEFETLAYVLEGSVDFGLDAKRASAHEMALFESEGAEVVALSDVGARFVLLAGQPLREPVVRYGPFVMNTREEIAEAIDDFRSGKFLEIKR
jgi:redox-sensitive bicupin YhaK (pirin superfamily)